MINNADKQNINLIDSMEGKSLLHRIGFYLNLANPLEWSFLFIFSVSATIFLLILDSMIAFGIDKRKKIISNPDMKVFNFLFWVISSIILFLIATSVGYFISPDADGSGTPEMKTVLAGINIYKYFSFNTMVAKSIGLLAALVGGASVGKVGPYIHLSCLICNRLMKLEYFSSINRSTSSKNNMLAAACAAGITLALGTPLGGVLFSIECTASIYVVSNIWKSFFCSVICILTSKLIGSNSNILLFDGDFALNLINNFNAEIFFYILEGVIGGLIGSMLSTLIGKIVYVRKRSKFSLLNNRFMYATLISLITSLSSYYFTPLRNTDRSLIDFSFNHNVSTKKDLLDLNHPNEGKMLFIIFSLKFAVSILCITVNMPAGVFGPFFCIGALFGKLYGHFMQVLFGFSHESVYAMLGASAVFSGATHSVSSALIIFEITGLTSYITPLLTATLVANFVGQSMSMGIFDVLSAIKNLPHLLTIKSPNLYSLTAADIVSKSNFVLTLDKFNIINSLNILFKLPNKYALSIPIIDEHYVIRFTVKPKNLFKCIMSIWEKEKSKYNLNTQNNIKEFLNFVKKKYFTMKKDFFRQIIYKFKKLYVTLRDKEKIKLSKNMETDANNRMLLKLIQMSEKDRNFLSKLIDINDINLSLERSAFQIDKNFPALRIQFLFTFLNISHIFVGSEQGLMGIITKEDFIKKAMSLK